MVDATTRTARGGRLVFAGGLVLAAVAILGFGQWFWAALAIRTVTEQVAFLTLVEHSPFFDTMRTLTILGTLSASQYGGNYAGVGWKLMGFEDQHVFTPPFGYYDLDYPGFHAVRDGVPVFFPAPLRPQPFQAPPKLRD